MKNLFSILLLFILTVLIIIACTKEEELTPDFVDTTIENREANVWICHKPDGTNPHAIWVNENAVAAHLAHGDVILDADGDGYTGINACGEGSMDDCDDTEASINPGVEEILNDGIDNDCNPETPDEGEDEDIDQDGFPASEDCDDNDPLVNPGATEIPYDGIDNDCDPATLDDDLDEDGFINEEDCDDDDAGIFPGAEELCDDEIDNDCDGFTDCDDPDCESECVEECDAEYFCDIIHLFDFHEPCPTDVVGGYGHGDAFCVNEIYYGFGLPLGWDVKIWDNDYELNQSCDESSDLEENDSGILQVICTYSYSTQTLEYRITGSLYLPDIYGWAVPPFNEVVDEATAIAHAQFLTQLAADNGLFDICIGGPEF